MIFHQILNEDSGCISYLIGCQDAGVAAVVDPGRDRVEEYLRMARRKDLRITHIVETHVHADHVSGNLELAEQTGSGIYLHAAAQARFDHRALRDGDRLTLGAVTLRVLHTPGHTPDSICLVGEDLSRAAVPWFVLTGDTLFVGDVGRPDLAGADGAGDLFDSLFGRLLTLDDSVEVYPAHGAGSSCGRGMSSKIASTIGFERRFNAALRWQRKEEFVAALMEGLPPKPANFTMIIARNRGLRPGLRLVPVPLEASAFRQRLERGMVAVDARPPVEFGKAHIPGSLNVSLESPQFAERVGWFVRQDAEVGLVVRHPDEVSAAARALSRVGIDRVVGDLSGGIDAWTAAGYETEDLPQMSGDALRSRLQAGDPLRVVDVREPAEWNAAHIAGAVLLPMRETVDRRKELDPERPVAVICHQGLRSSTVASLLRRAGDKRELYNVAGGMEAWQRSGCPVVTEADVDCARSARGGR